MPPVPNTNLHSYADSVQQRFRNPKIADTIARLAYDGSNRQPKFIVPVIVDQLRSGGDVDGLALVSALWCRYCFGVSDSGRHFAPSDPQWDALQSAAKAARSDPSRWICQSDIYGTLAQSPKFSSAFDRCLRSLWEAGVRNTLVNYANGSL